MQLVRGRFLVVEVSDKGDSDRPFVHVIGFAVGAVLLPDPPGGHFDLSVSFAQGPVIDQEMIPEAVRKAARLVREVDGFSVSLSGCRMMHNYIFPLRVRVEIYDVAYHSGAWDNEFPPHYQRVAGSHAVSRINGFGRHVVEPGNPPDSLHRPDLVVKGRWGAEISNALFDHFGWFGRRRS